jgi:hypothetical protein
VVILSGSNRTSCEISSVAATEFPFAAPPPTDGRE